MNEWEQVKEQINRNQQPRINYKALFGMSLTSYILMLRSQGFTSEEAYDRILRNQYSQLFMQYAKPGWKEKFKENVRISVVSRYAEQQHGDRMPLRTIQK